MYTVDHLSQTILTVEDHSEDLADSKADETTNLLNETTSKYLKEFFGDNSHTLGTTYPAYFKC